MFEKYTETARRSVFFARYEASGFGSEKIETEHLLLGILRENPGLTSRLLKSTQKVESIREQIEKHHARKQSIPTSVDLPLSSECKRSLEQAHKESQRRDQKHIAPEHLLLGIFMEEKSFGAKILRECGVTSAELSAEADRSAASTSASVAETLDALVNKSRRTLEREAAISRASAYTATPGQHSAETAAPVVVRNLSEAAREGKLHSLIGREREVERIIQVLSRRTRNNPVLVGEPGVGKTAILEGVAQRIANCDVPTVLADRPVFAVDASSLVAPSRRVRAGEGPERLLSLLTAEPIGILCVEGLLDLAANPGWGAIEATHVLEVLSRSGIHCIATGTSEGLRRAIENAGVLVRHFEVVDVAPPTEEEAVRILAGLKPQYEEFHGVLFGEGVIEAAVFASARFLPHRYLPDRALDLLDDAGARAKVRDREPKEELEIQQRLRQAARNMEMAIANHEFGKAQEYSEQEKQERERLRALRAKRDLAAPPDRSITVSDLEDALAERAGVSVSTVREILGQKKGKESQAVAQQLAAAVPKDQREWLPFLAAYLAGCSSDDADRLAQAIRQAKKD